MIDRPIKRMPIPTVELTRKIEEENAAITALRLQLADKNEEGEIVEISLQKCYSVV